MFKWGYLIAVLYLMMDQKKAKMAFAPSAVAGNNVQWSLYFKTTHGTKKMWSYIEGGLKIKVI